VTPDTEGTASHAGGRRGGRESALQMLYQWEVGRLTMPEVRRLFWDMGEEEDAPDVSDRSRSFATTLADGTVEHIGQIDPLIEQSAENWRLARMPVMDRLILRLAVYEFLHQAETPQPVVIDEALELAKRFSTPEAVKFINGVLEGIRKRLDPEGRTPV
jgi:transcription antitermination protein NusB